MKRSGFKRPAPETVRIGQMEFEIPAGISRAKRRLFLQAAEQHVLDTGNITVADAMRILRKRDVQVAKILARRPIRRRHIRGTKYSRRERDWDRMGWTKSLPCSLSRPGPPHPELWRSPADVDRCSGPVEAHHAGEHGLGNKAPDDTVVSLCSHHHRCLTDRSGIFSRWPRCCLKAWELALVADYQRAYAEHLAGLAAPQIY